jgi:hypothetical protein
VKATKPIVVFDLDQTIADGSSPGTCVARPGIREWMTSLKLLGFDIRVWTRANLDHATETIASLALDDFVSRCHEKPRWTEAEEISQEVAIRILGSLPALTVDDWPDERVKGVPFLQLDPWDGENVAPWSF